MLNQSRSQEEILGWIVKNQIRTNKNTPIEFREHAFLVAYLRDPANRIALRKSTQVGASLATIIKILKNSQSESRAINIIYTLPTGAVSKEFVVSKFDPVIENSSGLRSLVQKPEFKDKPIYSTTMKKIGNSFFFFKGSWSQLTAQMIDADVLVFDEIDFQKPDIISMYEERLTGVGSKDIMYWLGNPTIPNWGISSLYDESDQKEWHIGCPSCLKAQPLEWPESISMERRTFICRFCKKDLPDEARIKGVWIAKKKGRKISGYQMNKLMAPWIPAGKLIDSYYKESPKKFWNFSLGLPLKDKSSEVTDDLLDGCIARDGNIVNIIRKENPITIMGIDQKSVYHAIWGLSTSRGSLITGCEIFEDEEDLRKMMAAIAPNFIVMDGYPDNSTARRIQKQFGFSKMVLADIKTRSTIQDSPDKSFNYDMVKGIVGLDRTTSIDRMFEVLRSSGIYFSPSLRTVPIIFSHLKNLQSTYEEQYGKIRKVWKKTGEDDFAFALNFFQVGCDIMLPSFTPGRIALSRPPAGSPLEEGEAVPGTNLWANRDFEQTIRKMTGSNDIEFVPSRQSGYFPKGQNTN